MIILQTFLRVPQPALLLQVGGAGDRQHDGPARADHDEPRVLPTGTDEADVLALHARSAEGDRGREAGGAEGVRRRRRAARRQEGRLALRGRQEGARHLQVACMAKTNWIIPRNEPYFPGLMLSCYPVVG